jgi:radical SAM superfamily enzyme YgiQ (UPF0313 family)
LNTGYYPGFHHGLASLFGTLKNAGHHVALSHLTEESGLGETAENLRKKPADITALSFTTNQKKHAKKFLQALIPMDSLVIAGGVHCTLIGENIFDELPDLKAACIGEGEKPLLELCNRLKKNKDYTKINGFVFKTDKDIIKNPVGIPTNIDELALPDYSLFDYERIISDSGNCFQMMLSRGCPYSCHYCCNHAIRQVYPENSRYVRFASVPRAIEIIKHNLKLYPQAEKIVFADDTFTLNKKWLREFSGTYKENVGLPFLCNARVETINDQTVSYLKNGGCISIDFGVESGSEWLRTNILNRDHSNQQIASAFDLTGKFGLQRFSYCMVGLPFETKQMAQQTLQLNILLKPNFGKCFYFYPFPKTKLHQLCIDYNLLPDDMESVSGYLEKPCIKPVFMTHGQVKKIFDSLQIFFYSRLLFGRIKVPAFVENLVLKVLILCRRPVLSMLELIPKDPLIRRLRKMLRKTAMKYLR